jgi:hypothetical protein
VGSDADTGDAAATAYASGGGAVYSTASAEIGGVAAFGGAQTATAEGHSTGGGAVTVTAQLLRNVDPTAAATDIVLNDAASGSTSGLLTLKQTVSATVGDAITSLVATNPGGGALALEILARGGTGRDTVLGDILGTSTTGQAVSLLVQAAEAQDGHIVLENRSAGGPPTPAHIHGESNGGAFPVPSLVLRASAVASLPCTLFQAVADEELFPAPVAALVAVAFESASLDVPPAFELASAIALAGPIACVLVASAMAVAPSPRSGGDSRLPSPALAVALAVPPAKSESIVASASESPPAPALPGKPGTPP